jgi:hypothetical protein
VPECWGRAAPPGCMQRWHYDRTSANSSSSWASSSASSALPSSEASRVYAPWMLGLTGHPRRSRELEGGGQPLKMYTPVRQGAIIT